MATGMWLRSRTVATLAVMECLASVIFVVLWDVWSPIIKLDNAGVTTTHLALKLPEKKNIQLVYWHRRLPVNGVVKEMLEKGHS